MNANRLIFASCSLLLCFVIVTVFVGTAAAQQSAPSRDQDNDSAKQLAEPANQAPSQDNRASQPPATKIETWKQPQPGWLYVLDPRPGDAAGRISLIDPQTGKVMGSIRTSDHPDFALSPDGRRLYVASSISDDSSELAVIDTTRGLILESGTLTGRATYDKLPPFSTMAVSGDGVALRVLVDAPESKEKDAFQLATFDLRSGELLPGIVHLGNCGPGRFISNPAADHFDFFCPRTNRLRLIRVDANSRTLQNYDIQLPWERRIGVAEVLESSDSEAMSIVRGDGGVVGMTVATEEFGGTPVNPGLPNRVPPAAWPTSPDGKRVYLGYNRDYDKTDNRFYLDYGRPPNSRPASALAGEFRVYDTGTWAKLGTIHTKALFWNAVVSNDGKTLYAAAPQKHSILVIDTEKRHQTGVLKAGGAPALVVIAP